MHVTNLYNVLFSYLNVWHCPSHFWQCIIMYCTFYTMNVHVVTLHFTFTTMCVSVELSLHNIWKQLNFFNQESLFEGEKKGWWLIIHQKTNKTKTSSLYQKHKHPIIINAQFKITRKVCLPFGNCETKSHNVLTLS